jgi:hypothetical protein
MFPFVYETTFLAKSKTATHVSSPRQTASYPSTHDVGTTRPLQAVDDALVVI